MSAGDLQTQGSRVELRRTLTSSPASLTEWYENRPAGLEQGFTLSAAPGERQAGEALEVTLQLDHGWQAQVAADAQAATLSSADGQTQLHYDHLVVTDATGRLLAARMVAAGGALRLAVQDAGAQYPVTIDPTITQQAYLKASNTGANDFFGWSVAVAGDTVVVGAYLEASNATGVNGDGTNNSASQAGAAYVFTGVGVSNAPPTITAGATAIRQQGSAGSTATIATVSDDVTAAGAITVTATTVPAGITVTGISNSSGTITATVAADCTAATGNNTVVLTASDGNGATTTANLTVSVTANSAPTLTYPSNPAATYGTGLTINPLTGPSDNGSVSSVQVTPAVSGVTVNSAGIVTVASTVAAGSYTITIRATDDCGASTDASFPLGIVKATPVLTWTNPADITYGTALSATQLNATANVAGSFSYSPASGTVLNAGNAQNLAVTFTPTDTTNYSNASKTVTLNVLKATPVVTWNTPTDITYGTTLSATQLNATANVAGSFNYTPALNALLNAGNAQTLSVTFTPTDTANYNPASKTVTINVLKAAPVITWTNPADITYGTALSGTQLNATANVAGSFTYAPGLGTVLNAGNAQSLSVTLTPTNTANYNGTMKTVSVNVLKALLTVTGNNAFRNQGEANPPFSGAIVGLKNNDPITASYSTTANTSSAPGTYPITAILNDPNNCLGNYLVTNNAGTLTVLNSCGITVNPVTLPAATRGTPFVQTLSGSPVGSYTFSLYAGTLPPGVNLVNTLGIYSLRGTPTTAGTYVFTIKAKKNNSTCAGARTYTVVVP